MQTPSNHKIAEKTKIINNLKPSKSSTENKTIENDKDPVVISKKGDNKRDNTQRQDLSVRY